MTAAHTSSLSYSTTNHRAPPPAATDKRLVPTLPVLLVTRFGHVKPITQFHAANVVFRLLIGRLIWHFVEREHHRPVALAAGDNRRRLPGPISDAKAEVRLPIASRETPTLRAETAGALFGQPICWLRRSAAVICCQAGCW